MTTMTTAADTTYVELVDVMNNNPGIFEGLSEEQMKFFEAWLPENVYVYNEFTKYAFMLKNKMNRTRYSARAIWSRLRWDSYLTDTTQEYKLNSNVTPFVSRLVMAANKALRGMFMTKTFS